MLYVGDKDIENMTEEELDYLYRIKDSNSRKSLLPMFIYFILKAGKPKHYTQVELMQELKKSPYEIDVNRAAVKRALRTLSDEGVGAFISEKHGNWYDKAAVEIDLSEVFPEIEYDEPAIDMSEVKRAADKLIHKLDEMEDFGPSKLQRLNYWQYNFAACVIDELRERGLIEQISEHRYKKKNSVE